MIREGGALPATAGTTDVASTSQFDTLGGTLMLTFRAGLLGVFVTAKAVTYAIKLGSNVIAEGSLWTIAGEDLPILWQGEIGPGQLEFNITVPDGPTPTALPVWDITAT